MLYKTHPTDCPCFYDTIPPLRANDLAFANMYCKDTLSQ